jgi:hypothetical protein
MDIELIAAAVTTALAPFTPFLVEIKKVGSAKLLEVINEKGGDAAWSLAQKLWEKMKSHISENAEVAGATLTLSAKPEDESRQTALAIVLAAYLKENPKLAEELSDLLGGQNAIQHVIANRNSWIKDVTQQMRGNGEQVVRADNKSRITGVIQSKK